MIPHLFQPLLIYVASLLDLCAGVSTCEAMTQQEVASLKVEPGYQISFFQTGIEGARSLALGKRGTVFVGSRDAGNVYAIVPSGNSAQPNSVSVIAEGLHSPNGVAFKDGSLYVAENTRILKFAQIEDHLNEKPPYQVLYDQFPDSETHGWKYIAFGPDAHLYVSVGAPCNSCESSDSKFATIMRFTLSQQGSEKLTSPEIYASGVRNSVGFDWDPQTQELWFTDNGRDYLGDQVPPDELNHAPRKGMDFGFPSCHGSGIKDPVLGSKKDCSLTEKPAFELGPHVAALGMKFWNGDIILAEHGSWNRTVPIGYQVMRVKMKDGNPQASAPLVEGWFDGTKVRGRPVDVLVLNASTLLVSDDFANAIYKITKR